MPKRKASFAFPYERPSKLNKASSSVTVSESLNILTKRTSTPKKPIKILKWPSTNEHRTNEITENSVSPPLTLAGSSTPPSLRRASTLTLEDLKLSQNDDSNASSNSKLSEPKSKTAESSSIPRIPSGLTKFALGFDSVAGGSLHISKSALITGVDESEITSALDSLKSKVKKQPTNPKSPSIESDKPLVDGRSCNKDNNKSNDVGNISNDGGSSNEDIQIAECSNIKKVDSLVLYGSDYMQVVIAIDLSQDLSLESLLVCVEEVCTTLQTLRCQLVMDIPGIRFALMVFGGCIEGVKCTESTSWPELREFLESVKKSTRVQNVCPVHEILERVQTDFTWIPDSRRILVFINSVYSGKSETRDVILSCEALQQMEVKIYGVQIGNDVDAGKLNFEMSSSTGGMNLRLQTYHRIMDTILYICLRESNPYQLQKRKTFGYMYEPYFLQNVWRRLCELEEATPLEDSELPLKVNQTKTKISAPRKRTAKSPEPTQQAKKSKRTAVDKAQVKSSEKKRAATSSVKKSATTSTAKKQAATLSVKKRATTSTAKKRAASSTAKKQAATSSVKKRASASTAKKQATNSSAKKRAATSTAKKRATTSTAKKQVATLSVKKRATTSTAKKQAANLSVKKRAAASTAKKQATTSSAKKRAATSTGKKRATTSTAKVVTPSVKKRAATPSVKKRAATSTAKKQATTSSIKKRAATSTAKKQAVTSSVNKRAATPSVNKRAATSAAKKQATTLSVNKRATTSTVKKQAASSSVKKRAASSSVKKRASTSFVKHYLEMRAKKAVK